MMKIKITAVAIFILFSGFLNAQNISSALGRIETNFQFFTDTIDLEVTSQFILKKAGLFKSTHKSTDYNEGWGYGYGYGGGYESYHLEFVTTKEITTKEIKHPDYQYEITFVDSNNVILATKTFESDKVSHFTNPSTEGSPSFYAIDLIKLPISILDKTKEIYITEIVRKSSFF